MVRGACVGALFGAVWGVFLRVWMRLLVVESEFTWAGTAVIVVASALAGVGLGLVWAARRSGRSTRWRWAVVLAAPLVLFPQGILFLLPALLLGGLTLSGQPKPWMQVVLGLLTIAPVLTVGLVGGDSEPMAMPFLIVLVSFVALMAVLARAGAELFRPWPAGVAAPEAATPESVDTPADRAETSAG